MRLKKVVSVLIVAVMLSMAAGCGKSPASSGSSDSGTSSVNIDTGENSQEGSSQMTSNLSSETATANSSKQPSNTSKPTATSSKKTANTSSANNNTSSKLPDKAVPDGNDYSIKDGKMSEQVLHNYLNKAMTFNGLVSMSQYGDAPNGFNPSFERDMQFIRNVGPKYIGRAAYFWSYPKNMNIADYANYIKKGAEKVHAFDPEIILEAAIFETCYKRFTDTVKIPEYVFEAFGQQPENRNFSYEKMRNTSFANNFWGEENSSVPDITKLETKMWFYYWGTFYINAGYECIHMGQTMLIGSHDLNTDMRQNMKNFREVYDKLRAYAKQHGRRKFVLISSHAYDSKYTAYSDVATPKDYTQQKLMYDFHTFPIRPDDRGQVMGEDGFMPVKITQGHIDSIYGRGAGGLNPNGWMTKENPYIVEFDNCNVWNDIAQPTGTNAPWGMDESTWFTTQPMGTHGKIIKQFHQEITKISKGNGHLLMPCHQPIAKAYLGFYMSKPYVEDGVYYLGLNFEDTIKSIYASYNKK